MEITATQLYFGIVTMLTQVIEALAGFGATAIGLPFAVAFMPTGDASAMLNVNAFIVTILVTAMNFKKINWREYRRIVPLIIPFLPIGFFVGSSLKSYDMILKILLGAVIVFVAGRYLICTYVKKTAPAALRPAAQFAALFSGAVIHGIFTTGGPLVTLYTANKIPEKGEFRATMCAVFTTVNIVVISYRLFFAEMFTPFVVSTLLVSLPFLAAGFLVGICLHKRIHNNTFSKLVHFILLLGGMISLSVGIAAL